MDILITLIIGIVSTELFRYASGTLALGKINMISYSYYLILLQSYIGCFLVNCGFNKHYTLNYLLDRVSINTTTNVLWVLMLLMPLTVLIIFRAFHFDPQKEYLGYLNSEIDDKDDVFLYKVFALIIIAQTVVLTVFLFRIGYLPIIKLIQHDTEFDFATERIRIQSITILGSGIATNIVIKFGIPLVSYIACSYAYINRIRKWIIMAAVSFCMGVIVKTIDFSKSPLVFFFLVFVFIYIYSNKNGIKDRVIVVFGCVMALLLMAFYVLQGYKGTFLDLYNGILGRTLFTQFGTLCYHFDLFPKVFPFLAGRSLSPTILKILGMDPSLYLRSARLVMSYYGIEHLYDGTAGVMNALFVGEAYANWGMIGAMFSIIWVAAYISLFFILFIRSGKSPVSIAILAFMTQTIGSMIQGGFTDFIYSSTILITLAFYLLLMNYKKLPVFWDRSEKSKKWEKL